MRIAVNTRMLIRDRLTGIGHFTYELLQKLVKDHPKVDFIFLFDRPYDDQFIFAPNITPVIVNPPARASFLFYIWFELAIPRVLKKYKADVFLSPDNFMSLSAHIPTLLVVHDLAFEHYPENIPYFQLKFYQYFVPKYIHKATRIATVSKATSDDIKAHYPVDPEKIDIVHLGLNEGFKKNSKSEMGNYFIHLGTIQPRKNIIGLLKAFELYKDKTGDESRLLFIGSKGWKDESIYKFLEGMKHRKDVEMTGYLTNKEISDKLNNAIALLCVSFFEGFGMPVIEAQQCGCPVICSNVSSLPEASGDAALIIDPMNTDSIADAMIQIKSDSSLREKLILSGFENVKKYSWQKTADKVWESLQKLSF